jgi:hypothetical protein
MTPRPTQVLETSLPTVRLLHFLETQIGSGTKLIIISVAADGSLPGIANLCYFD